jgi:hypothetical protein
MKHIFISHSCKDHFLTNALVNGINNYKLNVIIDPFILGDKTCDRIQDSIKGSTHFILLLTQNSYSSYWVKIEALFAQLCYKQNAICYFPINIDGIHSIEPSRELMHISWDTTENINKLITLLVKSIKSTSPTSKLPTDIIQSDLLKEQGREFERIHAGAGDVFYLHKAVESYEKAIQLNFCNHNSWANLAWSLWKLNEINPSWKCIQIAEDISPDSNHVKDVKQRMLSGKRSIF